MYNEQCIADHPWPFEKFTLAIKPFCTLCRTLRNWQRSFNLRQSKLKSSLSCSAPVTHEQWERKTWTINIPGNLSAHKDSLKFDLQNPSVSSLILCRHGLLVFMWWNAWHSFPRLRLAVNFINRIRRRVGNRAASKTDMQSIRHISISHVSYSWQSCEKSRSLRSGCVVGLKAFPVQWRILRSR